LEFSKPFLAIGGDSRGDGLGKIKISMGGVKGAWIILNSKETRKRRTKRALIFDDRAAIPNKAKRNAGPEKQLVLRSCHGGQSELEGHLAGPIRGNSNYANMKARAGRKNSDVGRTKTVSSTT